MAALLIAGILPGPCLALLWLFYLSLAVAGQEAFITNIPEEAWVWVKAKHPEDDGGFVRYVIPEKGPRIYANRRLVAVV